jgi:isopenicillin N synthase-like dioxygenase
LPIVPSGAATLPVIDLSGDPDAVSEAIVAACREWGMFLVTGHGIAPDILEHCRRRALAFFAQPPATKRAFSRSLDNPWGYYDRELTKTVRDKKEIFDVGPDTRDPADPFAGETPWPDRGGALETGVRAAMRAFEALAARLTAIVAAAFAPTSTSFLRLNHYPTGDPLADLDRSDAGRAVHHHSDAGALTVLYEDGVPGLQVLRGGCWHDVIPVSGALVVNIGDMMQVWSNDLYPAPIHRVLAMTARERFSAPFFYNPSYRATIAPLPEVAGRTGGARYRPIAWAEFRRRRAEGDYGDYGTEVQIGDYRIAPSAQ